MPIDLVLVRHGESEGNVAMNASKRGDDSLLTPEFLAQHSSRWRLSEGGRNQARATGRWLRREFPDGFGRYYTSEYTRAMETAGLLDLPGAEWFISPYLRERNWGDLDRITNEERQALAARVFADRDITPYYWRPPNGEALVEVCDRLRNVLETMHRECSDRSVIVVCHGEVMESIRIELERMSEAEYMAWEEAKRSDPSLKIRNCQVWHYTRRDPQTGELAPHLGWKRSALPWAGEEGPWEEVRRPRYSNAELLELAERSPELLRRGAGESARA